jgi:hypothetical protein
MSIFCDYEFKREVFDWFIQKLDLFLHSSMKI